MSFLKTYKTHTHILFYSLASSTYFWWTHFFTQTCIRYFKKKSIEWQTSSTFFSQSKCSFFTTNQQRGKAKVSDRGCETYYFARESKTSYKMHNLWGDSSLFFKTFHSLFFPLRQWFISSSTPKNISLIIAHCILNTPETPNWLQNAFLYILFS